MKRYVCKEKLKTGLLAIILDVIFPVLISFIIVFLAKFDGKAIVASIVLCTFWIAMMLTITLFELRRYFGRISIKNNKVVLYLFKKEYPIRFGQTCIMYIEPDKVSRFSKQKLVSVKLRIKGEKNVIPVKIMDSEIIKELFALLEIRKNPQDYMFEWEKKGNIAVL